MGFDYSIDLISDLGLNSSSQFDWTGKPTSLFCVVAGNISSDMDVVRRVLEHLGTLYRGVFFIDGTLEHTNIFDYNSRIEELAEMCKSLKNVIYMHNHVVVLNGIGFIAANGWHGVHQWDKTREENLEISRLQHEEVAYLGHTIKGLQLHGDVNKIVVITNSIPFDSFLYNNIPWDYSGIEPGLSLVMDTDVKVTHWLYGGTEISNDCFDGGRRFVNNPHLDGQPYWPKRIII